MFFLLNLGTFLFFLYRTLRLKERRSIQYKNVPRNQALLKITIPPNTATVHALAIVKKKWKSLWKLAQ